MPSLMDCMNYLSPMSSTYAVANLRFGGAQGGTRHTVPDLEGEFTGPVRLHEQ